MITQIHHLVNLQKLIHMEAFNYTMKSIATSRQFLPGIVTFLPEQRISDSATIQVHTQIGHFQARMWVME